MSLLSKNDELTLLQEMLEIYSPSEQEEEISNYLYSRFRSFGFETHQDSAGNVIGATGSGDKEVILLGHMDTVGGFLPVRQVNGHIYGRGAVDAKGSLATFIAATARVASAIKKRVVVIGVVEEETSSRGARALLSHFRPDSVIIGEPSGWEHITLAYKGRILVRYHLSSRVRHSSAEGPSASERAVEFWNRLIGYAQQINQNDRWHFNTLDPFLRRITSSAGDYAEEVIMDITMRMPFDLDVAALKEQMRSWAGEAAVGFSGEDQPYKASKNTPLVRAFLRSIRGQGGSPTFKLKLGTSDMNTVGPVWKCPIIAYGPGDSALDHTPEEHIEIEEYYRAIEVVSQALVNL
jgi:LysW-gamma-L-lysine carboxypeptidase